MSRSDSSGLWSKLIAVCISVYILNVFFHRLLSLVALSVILISDIDAKVQGGLAVLFVLLFVIGFAMGLGAVVWVIMSEIMPTRLRVKAMSLFLSINWVCNIVISFLTLTAISELGGESEGESMNPVQCCRLVMFANLSACVLMSGHDLTDDEIAADQKKGVGYLYFIFAGFTLAAVIFMYFCVPETKGKSPEDLMGHAVHTPLLHSSHGGALNTSAEETKSTSSQL